MKTFDQVVIGGGFSGMLAAHRAASEDKRVLIIEAKDYLGGFVFNGSIGHHHVDLGAESFSVIKDDLQVLVGELGLESELVRPNPVGASLLTGGSRIRIPQGYLGVPLDLEDPSLRKVFNETEIAEAKRLDSLPFSFATGTVFDLISSRLGEVFSTRLIDPVIAGVHGSSSHNLDAEVIFANILPKARELGSLVAAVHYSRSESNKDSARSKPGSAVMGLLGGMKTLIDALAERLRLKSVVVQLASEVRSVTRVDNHWKVATQNGSILTDKLSVCTGPQAVAKLFIGEVGSAAEQFNLVDVAIVGLLVESDELNSYPLGTGALIAAGQGHLAKATTHTNAKWSWIQESLPKNQHLIRISYGRDGVIPTGDLEVLASSEIGSIYGISKYAVLETVLIAWPGALVQSNQKVLSDFQRVTKDLEDVGLEFCGAFLSGNGLLGLATEHNKRRNA
jgi:oxygen-dependent protoporphyrinogen oxidase